MIQRRTLLVAGAALGLAKQAGAQDVSPAHVAGGSIMTLKDCIDQCTASHKICLETAAHLLVDLSSTSASVITILTDCAEICQATANSMLRSSVLHPILCGACAEACERCAQHCLRFGIDPQLARCAGTCRECAAGCRMMVSMAT